MAYKMKMIMFFNFFEPDKNKDAFRKFFTHSFDKFITNGQGNLAIRIFI